MSIYDINFSLQVRRLLPPFLRQTKQIAWLTALVKPLQELRDSIFDTYFPDVVKRARHSSQTIVFEKILNQFYNLTSGPLIYIETQTLDNFNSFLGVDENTEVYVGIDNFTDAYTGTSYSLATTNFIVFVPSYLTYVEEEMKALIDSIKPYGTTYSIQSY